jgi:hypothetical protein
VPERAYYSDTVVDFLSRDDTFILGKLTSASGFAIDLPQREAWLEEIRILKDALQRFEAGHVFLEFVVPRLGKRIDAVVLLDDSIFVVEFKVGARHFASADIHQVWDYALDLKNFHETSREQPIKPVLVITGFRGELHLGPERPDDQVFDPARVTADRLGDFLAGIPALPQATALVAREWQDGRYRPTPTIIEAATSLFRRHSVQEIARHDAGAKNLARTAEAIASIIERSRDLGWKSICLVTGVPGAGKTLVGLDVATRFLDASSDLHSQRQGRTRETPGSLDAQRRRATGCPGLYTGGASLPR